MWFNLAKSEVNIGFITFKQPGAGLGSMMSNKEGEGENPIQKKDI